MNKYQDTATILAELGLSELNLGVSNRNRIGMDTEGAITSSFLHPIDGKEIAKVKKCLLSRRL